MTTDFATLVKEQIRNSNPLDSVNAPPNNNTALLLSVFKGSANQNYVVVGASKDNNSIHFIP